MYFEFGISGRKYEERFVSFSQVKPLELKATSSKVHVEKLERDSHEGKLKVLENACWQMGRGRVGVAVQFDVLTRSS